MAYEMATSQKYADDMKMDLIRVDKNGSKHYEGWIPCDRCGSDDGIFYVGTHNGQLIPSRLDAGVCWKCHGRGKVLGKAIVRTDEYQAQLDARREARWKKRMQKEADEWWDKHGDWFCDYAAYQVKLREEEARKAAEEASRKAASQYVGQIGDRVEIEVTLDHSFEYEIPCFGAPWESETMTGYVFKTDDGNVLIWKTTGSLSYKKYAPNGEDKVDGEKCYVSDRGGWYVNEHPSNGDKIVIKGTIKTHEEYDGTKQTILTRVKWVR